MYTEDVNHHDPAAPRAGDARSPRFSVRELLPDALAGLVRASRHPEGPLGESTLELVSLRASQMNGCAFCCDLHGRRAAAAGVDELVLRALAGWRDLSALDVRDRAALAVAEAVTRLDGGAQLEAILAEGLSASAGWRRSSPRRRRSAPGTV